MFSGCLPEKKDLRDYTFSPQAVGATDFPKEYILDMLSPVKNQGKVSSCVAHAMSTILEYHEKEHILSTNFFYGGRCILYGRTGRGMYLRDACKIAKDYGDPYNLSCKGNTEAPWCADDVRGVFENKKILKEAKRQQILSYASLKNIEDIKYAIMNYGPVLVSIKWYHDTYLSERILQSSKQTGYGLHAIVLYGWSEEGFYFQNSWGVTWGEEGRAILPYDYGIEEAWSIVDKDNNDLKKPVKSKFLDILFKAINSILNFFKKAERSNG